MDTIGKRIKVHSAFLYSLAICGSSGSEKHNGGRRL